MSVKPSFSGEVQLAGWSESHTGGCKVTFWLASPEDLDAFRAMTVRKGGQAGQRLACVLVEIGDDEQPIEPPAPPAPTPAPAEPKQRASKPLARWLALRCMDSEFQRWASDAAGHKIIGENAAAQFVRDACGVESRGDIDGNAEAEHLFHKLIRGPYSKHCIARGIHDERS